jgi:L-iditol 2-dehydrogenase
LLKKRGVPKVIACDISKKRLEAAEEAGADIVIDALKKDIIQVVMQETRGEGADAVIQCDDRPIVVFQAMNIVRNRGKIWTTRGAFLRLNPALIPQQAPTVFSMPPEAGAMTETAISLDPSLASMMSGFGYGHRLSRFQEVVDLMQSGKCTADKLVTHVFPLDKITEAFKIAMDPHETIKVIVEP